MLRKPYLENVNTERSRLIDRKIYEELLGKDGLISKKYETVQYLLFFERRVYGMGTGT